MTKIELHILQNFAPSNLNRDDTGAPKDCEFGGYRRARISSQCFKRAIREAFKVGGDFEPSMLAARTKRIVQQVADALEQKGHSNDESIAVAVAAIAGAGLGVKGADEDYKTEYLLFLPRRCIEEVAVILHDNWEAIGVVVAAAKDKPTDEDKAKKKASKAQAKGEFPKELGKQLRSVLMDASKTPDLALFGRMIADEPGANVEAACQVAQAISTNRMSMDFDFFTAVDDLRGRETAGSDMMGTVQFSSACFYRYLVVDCEALRANLGDAAMVEDCLRGFLHAAFAAIPTGKQNSMAAHNPPSYVLSVVRNGGAPVSLANAFLQPARPAEGRDLVDASIVALETYLGTVGRMGATRGVVQRISVADRALADVDGVQRAKNVDDLVAATVKAAASAGVTERGSRMKSVVLRLEGPMQSWGTQGRYSIRDTDNEPSKSGVLGLVGAALGMKRDDHELLARLRSLRMAVRIDRPGRVMRDFHTVGAGTFRGQPHSMWGLEGKTVVTQRHYLADAAFTVALGHVDEVFVRRIAEALQNPVWPLFLGRRSCAPSVPVFVELVEGAPDLSVCGTPPARGAGSRLRLVVEVEHATEGDPRSDDPQSFDSGDRRYGFRHVAERWVEYTAAEEEAST